MFNDANQLLNVGEAGEFLSLLGLKCKTVIFLLNKYQ